MPNRLPSDEAAILSSPEDNGGQDSTVGRWVLTAAILGSSMAFIDTTVVNVALPALQKFFHATGSDMQWVVESYALFLAALLLVGGSLGDVYGRKKSFLAGVVIFAAASVWCGFAQTIHALVAARAVQGIGAALLVPGSLALISSTFPVATRGKAIGTWSGFTAITAAVGPLIGGWLVQYVSWRWIFFMNLPLAVSVIVVSLGKIPEIRGQSGSKHLDWLGAILATAGLGCVTFCLIEFSSGGLVMPIGIFGGCSLVAFIFVESRAPNAMMPLRLFRSRDFSGANLMTLFLYAALGGVLYFLPLNLIQVQHYSPTEAGAALLPFILLMFFLSRWSGGLVARYGKRIPLLIGPLIVAAGFALLIVPGVGGAYWRTFFPAILVLGFGMAVSVAPLTTVVMSAVAQESAGSASGVNNAVSRVASLLALALFGTLFLPVFARALQSNLRNPEVSPQARREVFAQRGRLAAIESADPAATKAVETAFVQAFRFVLAIAVALSLLASVSAAALIRPSGSLENGLPRSLV